MYHGAAYLALLGALRQEQLLGDAARQRRSTDTVRPRGNGRLNNPLAAILPRHES